MYVAAWMLRPNWKGKVRLSLWEWQGVETEESRCCFSASGRGWAVLTLAGGEGQPDTGQGEYHHQQQKTTLGATECFQTVGKLLSSSHQSCKQRRRRGHKFAKTLFKAENFSTSKKLSSPYFKTPSRSSSGTLDSLGGGRGRWTWIIGAFWELRHGPPGGWVALGQHCALNWRT